MRTNEPIKLELSMPYVFAFEEGSKEQKYLLGGKGANLAEMTKLGLPVPPGLHDHDRGVQRLHGRRRQHPRRPHGRGRRGARRARGQDGQAARRPRRPAAGVGALGRAVLDAGDDGHRPQPRAQRRVGRWAREADRQRAVRVRLVPPLRADVRQDRARHRRRAVRARARPSCASERGVADRPRALGRGPRRAWSSAFKAIVLRGGRHRVPAGPDGAAPLRDRSGVPVVERRARA